MEAKIKNAIITKTFLGYQDHGICTYLIYLDYGGVTQSGGGYTLDAPIRGERIGTAFGMQQIMGLLDCLGIRSWEELVGQRVRVDAEHGRVLRIGHFLEDNWFTFGEPTLEEEGDNE